MIRKLADYLKDRRALFGKEFPGPFSATDRRKWESAMGFLLRTLSDMERNNVRGVYDGADDLTKGISENLDTEKDKKKHDKAKKKGK